MPNIVMTGMNVSWHRFPIKSKKKLRESGFREGVPMYRNSTKVDCEKCGEKLWLGPRQQQALDTIGSNVNLSVLCNACAVSDSKRNPGVIAHFGNEPCESPAR